MKPPHPPSSAGRSIVARDFPKNHPPPAAAAGTRSDERTTAYYNPITGEETATHRGHVASLQQRWDAEENNDDQEGSPPTLFFGVSGGVGYDAGKVARPNPDQPSSTRMIKSAELGSKRQDSDGVAPPTAPPSAPRTVARGDENGGNKVAARSEADDCRGASEDNVASAGTFEELVMAEMERLRLEYSHAAAEVKAKNDNDAAPPSSPSSSSNNNHHHGGQQQAQSITTATSTVSPRPDRQIPLLGRDEEQELATRRQKAKEYGTLLRLQMEQDRLKRKADGSHSRNDDDFSPASTSVSTDYENGNARVRSTQSTDGTSDGDVTSRSYGELLRIQILDDQERRRKQKEEIRRGSAAAEAAVDAMGKPDHLTKTSKQQKAAEYKRQLDEQVAAKASGRRPVHVSNTRAVLTETTMAVGTKNDQSGGDSANTVLVEQPTSTSLPSESYAYGQDTSNEKRKKEEYAQQLREQMDADIARRVQRHDGDQTLESSGVSSVLASTWHFADDREAEERRQRRDAALEQQRLLELQIKEQKEAKARRKKEEDEALVPLPAPNPSADKTVQSHHCPPIDVDSDECQLLDAESVFIPASSPTIKRNPRKSPNASTSFPQKDTNICSVRSPVIRRERGGEAFTVTIDDANGAGANKEWSMVSLKASTTETVSRAASRKKTQSSHRRMSRPKPEASTPRPPLESPVVTSEGSQCGMADENEDEDDALVKDILRSALRRIENNVPHKDNGTNADRLEKSVHVKPKEENENNAPKEESEILGRGHQSFAPSSAHVHESHRSNIDLEDFDEYLDDDEEAEEERLRQALSRIRNTIDTSLTS